MTTTDFSDIPNDDPLTGTTPEGHSTLLLHTFDEHNHRLVSPVRYEKQDEGYVVAAISDATSRCKPVWYLNLKRRPVVEVELDHERHAAMATTPTGVGRVRLWPTIRELCQRIYENADATHNRDPAGPRPIAAVMLRPIP